MFKRNPQVTDAWRFYEGHDPISLVRQFGSPLYVYNERILRRTMREMLAMCPYPRLQVNFSAKANSNLAILQIARQENVSVDAVSPGEILLELAAGFRPENILFIANNVSCEEMIFAQERGVLLSVDSLSQLERFGRLFPGADVCVRFNPGVGAGHHEKVVTAGKDTKFGVNPEYIPDVRHILQKYRLRLAGINQHIGSLFMEGSAYELAFEKLLEIARQFDSLDFIDLGGGFGIPYRKQQGEARLDLASLGQSLAARMAAFSAGYGRELTFKLEPGRYIPAESGILLGTVHSVKRNGSDKYIGTDIGFSALIRPTLYDAYHEIEVYSENAALPAATETVSVVGNICESGDYLAKNRELPVMAEEDVIAVLDAGAYGHVMSSNYNCRLRPAEVLLRESGEAVLIRRRDSYDDLLAPMIKLVSDE